MGHHTLAQLEDALNSEGTKVIDTSAISTNFFNEYFETKDLQKIISLIKREINFHSSLEGLFSQNSVSSYFPEETIKESIRLTRKIRDLHDDLSQGGSYKNSRDGRKISCPRGNPLNRDLINLSITKLKTLLSKRKNCLRVLFRHKLEEHLAPHELSFLEGIQRACVNICNRPNVLRGPKAEKKGSNPNPSYRDDDGNIFAKAFAMSYYDRVRLITADSDFLRIAKIFYNSPDYFSERYRFPLPTEPVDIIFLTEDTTFSLQAGYKEKEVIWQKANPQKANL